MIMLLVMLAALAGAVATFNRGCGFPGPAPDWLPRWLASDEYNAGEKHWSWGFRRWAKVLAAGAAATVISGANYADPMQLGAAALVGIATAGTFSLGHSILPGRDAPAHVLNLMDGWTTRGAIEGTISGALLVLPMAVLVFATSWMIGKASIDLAILVLLGGMLKPWCYFTAGLLVRRPGNPDQVASALHGATAWGGMAVAVLLAG